jgi:hypothetical protein
MPCEKSDPPEEFKSMPTVPSEEDVPLALPPDTEPELDASDGDTAPEKFTFHMTRETKTTNWGVDLQSDSAKTLTIATLEPGLALAKCNANASTYAAKPVKPGDVIVSIEGATSQAEMVEKLKNNTSLMVDIVRYAKFVAVIERDADPYLPDSQEPLGMSLIRTSKGKLLIDDIDLRPSPIKRYNATNFLKPLVAGDMIVAVGDATTSDGMIQQITTGKKLVLSIERRPTISRKSSKDSVRSQSSESTKTSSKDSVRSQTAAAA